MPFVCLFMRKCVCALNEDNYADRLHSLAAVTIQYITDSGWSR